MQTYICLQADDRLKIFRVVEAHNEYSAALIVMNCETWDGVKLEPKPIYLGKHQFNDSQEWSYWMSGNPMQVRPDAWFITEKPEV